MEGEEGGLRLSKRINNGEVDYKTKAGTAWSHSYLNQKPWHPLSYPNQRRKWIAEQTHAQRDRRSEEVAREYAQEQEFFRQTALISNKEKEKMEIMQAVSFMYVRPPGYNAESAKAAEINDESKNQEQDNHSQEPITEGGTSTIPRESMPAMDCSREERKKPRPKDVFGRPLPTEEEFEVLKNAPRLETGVPARVKPFGIEVRNVKCLRCGNYGHQSGDRECPLKDAIMPNEESRLKRDDPLTAIMARVDPSEPLKWELKQKPGMSPPHGGFNPDDPNQQIVAEDIFDEYGGFLSGGNIPELLTNFPSSKTRKKSKMCKRKRELSPIREFRDPDENGLVTPSENAGRRSKGKKKKKKKLNYSGSSSSDDSEFGFGRHSKRSRRERPYASEESDLDQHHRSKRSKQKHTYSSEESDHDRNGNSKRRRRKHSDSSKDEHSDRHHRSKSSRNKRSHLPQRSPGRHYRREKSRHQQYYRRSSDDSDGNRRSKYHSRRGSRQSDSLSE